MFIHNTTGSLPPRHVGWYMYAISRSLYIRTIPFIIIIIIAIFVCVLCDRNRDRPSLIYRWLLAHGPVFNNNSNKNNGERVCVSINWLYGCVNRHFVHIGCTVQHAYEINELGAMCWQRERESARPADDFRLIMVTSQPTLTLSVYATCVCVCYLLKVVIVQLQFSY